MLSNNEPNPSANVIVIFVTGPFSAGKTAFIKTISETEAIWTEIPGLSPGFDFGQVILGPNEAIYFFGGPGARRFQIEWIQRFSEYFHTSEVAIIELFDPSRPETFREATAVLDRVRTAEVTYIVAANIRYNPPRNTPPDEDKSMSLEKQYEYIEMMKKRWEENNVRVCNALDKKSVKKVVVELLQMLPSESLTEQAILRVQAL